MPNIVTEIWKKDKKPNRSYSYVFEVYEKKSQNEESTEVEIFIAIKK